MGEIMVYFVDLTNHIASDTALSSLLKLLSRMVGILNII
jgi:hypothetical protein